MIGMIFVYCALLNSSVLSAYIKHGICYVVDLPSHMIETQYYTHTRIQGVN